MDAPARVKDYIINSAGSALMGEARCRNLRASYQWKFGICEEFYYDASSKK